MEVKERIAYVRGLMEGSATPNDASTRVLWENLLKVCDGLADSVNALSTAQGEAEEYIEAIDEDLCQLEEDFYGADTDLQEQEEEELYLDDDEDYDESVVRAECPRCGEEAFFDEAYLYDDSVEVSCPECGEILYRGREHAIEFDDNNHHADHDVSYPAAESADFGSTHFSPDN